MKDEQILKLSCKELLDYWRKHSKEPKFTKWLDKIEKRVKEKNESNRTELRDSKY